MSWLVPPLLMSVELFHTTSDPEMAGLVCDEVAPLDVTCVRLPLTVADAGTNRPANATSATGAIRRTNRMPGLYAPTTDILTTTFWPCNCMNALTKYDFIVRFKFVSQFTSISEGVLRNLSSCRRQSGDSARRQHGRRRPRR